MRLYNSTDVYQAVEITQSDPYLPWGPIGANLRMHITYAQSDLSRKGIKSWIVHNLTTNKSEIIKDEDFKKRFVEMEMWDPEIAGAVTPVSMLEDIEFTLKKNELLDKMSAIRAELRELEEARDLGVN